MLSKKDVVKNYYTGEKWFLVSIDGGETYISEAKYIELNREAIEKMKQSRLEGKE